MAKTLTSDGEEVFVSFPIEKTETNADGDVIVYGKATDGSVDSDMQVVDPEWSAKALQHWLKTGGNLRVMHNGQRDPAGKGLAVEVTPDGHYVKALVVEPVAKELVKKGVLRAYSVGIVHPKIDQDPTGKAMGGIIRGGPLTEISELSLVDRPANRNCQVQLVKRAKDGTPEVSGKVFGEHDLLGKMQTDEPSVTTEVNVSLPDDVTISFTPNDLAKILNHRGGVAEKKRNFDPNVGGGVDRAKLPSKDFAGRGRSFPIVTPADVSDAAQSIGRAGASNYSADKLKANIIRIARRKGAEFVAQLPESWKSDVGKAADADLTKEPKDQKKPFPGAKKPFGKKGDADEPDTEEKDDTDESPAEKAARKAVSDILGRVVKNDDSSDEDEPDDEQDTDVDDDVDGHDVSSNAGNTETSDEDAQGDKPKADKSAPSPADGVKGHNTKPVPSHREPDGPDVEALEHDMKVPTDPDAEFKAAQRHKAIGIDHALGTLHDLTCPAYDPAEVAKSYPTASLSNIDVNAWQQKAMDAAASAPFDEANRITRLWQHAVTIKGADPRDLEELQWVAHKAFQDANPGPTKAPTPCELSPKKFNRPYLSAGHSAASPGHDGPNTAHVPANDIAAAQFERGYESAGRAADSPGNVHTRTGVSTPATTGKVGRVGYENLMKDNAAQAMRAMHDHIAQTFPDVCAIGPNSPEHAEVKHPVPTPAGTPNVSAVKSKAKLQARLTDDVLKGKLTIDEAIKKMMTEPVDEDKPKAKKAKKKKGKKGKKPFPPFVAADTKDDAVDDKVGKAMTGGNVIASQAIVELQKQLNEATKMLKKQAKVIDDLASQPDTSNLPFRGAVSQYNSQLSEPLGGVQKMAAVQDRTQFAVMAQLEEQFRTSPDPAQREAAWSALTKMRGIPT